MGALLHRVHRETRAERQYLVWVAGRADGPDPVGAAEIPGVRHGLNSTPDRNGSPVEHGQGYGVDDLAGEGERGRGVRASCGDDRQRRDARKRLTRSKHGRRIQRDHDFFGRVFGVKLIVDRDHEHVT